MKNFGMFAELCVSFVKMHSKTEEWKAEFGTKVEGNARSVFNTWL